MRKKRYRILEVLIMALAVSSVLVLNMGTNFIKTAFAMDEKEKIKESGQSDSGRLQLLARLKNQTDDSAISSAQVYLAAHPDDTDVMNLLAEAYINKNNLFAAEETVKKAIAVKPNDPFHSKLLAKIYTLRAFKDPANFARALEQIEKALVSNPNDASLLSDKAKVYVAEAKMYMAQNNIEKANEAIDMAISLSSDSDKSEFVSMKEMINKPALVKPKINE